MKQIKGMQLGAVLAAMLILIATIAVPVAVAETNTGASTGSTQTIDSGCGCSGGCGSNITAVQLNGSEANKAIADVLKNEDFKVLRNKLIQMGYTPMRNEASTYAFAGNVNSTDIITVVVPFDTNNIGNASILWASTNGNITIRAIISGAAVLSSEPMNILTANDNYKEIAKNLTSLGYKVNEGDATIFIRSSMIATIIIPIDGKPDAIRGVVDINTGKVVSVQNGFWGCVTDCVCNADPFNCIVVLSGCTGACGSCIAVPNPWTCIPCAGCLLGTGYCVGACL